MTTPPPDYVGAIFVKDGDKLDYGVRGMKWGVRRSSSQLKAAAAVRENSSTTSSTPSSKAQKKVAAIKNDPGWLRATTKSVLQSSAKKSMQSLSDEVVNKYITSKLLAQINAPENFDTRVRKEAAKVIGDERFKTAVEQAVNAARGSAR